MKRLIPVSGVSWRDSVVLCKKYFQRWNVWGFSDLKWCNSGVGRKKSEKKFGKSLQVQKKCLPLQSRYETRAPHWGPEMSSGSQKESAGRHWVWRSWLKRLERKYKEASTNNTKIESVDFFKRNWECRSRTWRIRNIQRRVWSWLRMNASGRLNTCKSRGSAG